MKRHIFLLIALLSLIAPSYAEPMLTELNGNKVAMNALQGKWVLINYWASWCGPCLAEIEELNKFYQSKPDNIVLYAVNFDMLSRSKQRQLITKFNIQYPSLAEDPSKQLNLGYVEGVPATFVFAPDGHLKTVLYGPQTKESLMSALS